MDKESAPIVNIPYHDEGYLIPSHNDTSTDFKLYVQKGVNGYWIYHIHINNLIYLDSLNIERLIQEDPDQDRINIFMAKMRYSPIEVKKKADNSVCPELSQILLRACNNLESSIQKRYGSACSIKLEYTDPRFRIIFEPILLMLGYDWPGKNCLAQ